MLLTLYNTLTRRQEALETIEPGRVRMYVCGPTVYADAHIGHAMSAIVFDMVRRYLIYRGFDVYYATNFTDVDEAHDQVTVYNGWSSPAVPSTVGTFRLSQYLSKEFKQASGWCKCSEGIGSGIVDRPPHCRTSQRHDSC